MKPPSRSCSVVFTGGCLFNESSGPYLSMVQTARRLAERGHRITVLGTRGKESGQPALGGLDVRAFRRCGPYSFHFAPGLSQWLRQHPHDWDLASMQGVWMHTNRAMNLWCLRHNRPYMITAHGNFNPLALKVSAWKKWLARHTFMQSVFRYATCYQALSEREYRVLRDYGIKQPICIVGNGMELPDVATMPDPNALLPNESLARRTCLYLGRLHPIKGIDRLLRAWVLLRPSQDWQLVIAGGGDPAYRAQLERIAQQVPNVRFTGPVFGDLKAAWLQRAEFLVLPSYSEAFPMTAMEAFSYAKPVLLTVSCGFHTAAEAGAAVQVPSSEAGIRDGLEELLALTPARLQDMGARALRLVRERYDWRSICTQLEAVYEWMRGGGCVPDCLRID